MDCGVREAVLGPTHGWEGRGEDASRYEQPGNTQLRYPWRLVGYPLRLAVTSRRLCLRIRAVTIWPPGGMPKGRRRNRRNTEGEREGDREREWSGTQGSERGRGNKWDRGRLHQKAGWYSRSLRWLIIHGDWLRTIGSKPRTPFGRVPTGSI